jgi:hypothetical protein
MVGLNTFAHTWVYKGLNERARIGEQTHEVRLEGREQQ